MLPLNLCYCLLHNDFFLNSCVSIIVKMLHHIVINLHEIFQSAFSLVCKVPALVLENLENLTYGKLSFLIG